MPSKNPSPNTTTFKAPQISVVFMGTPEFARTALSALITESYNIVGVVTQPDRPVGRTQKITASPVKILANEHGIPVFQPEKMNPEAVEVIRAWKPDVIVVAAYGRILPESVLALPGFGCINIHASLLPRWRGASPIANALIAGDTETGITLIELNAGLDTGDIIASEKLPIGPDERASELLVRLATLGASLLIRTLPQWITRTLSAIPQPTDGVTLCQLIEREDGHVFWSEPAEEIYNRYRGLYPWPGIFTYWRHGDTGIQRIKLHEITLQKEPQPTEYPIGTVCMIGDKVGIVTGVGTIYPLTLQLEGKETTSIAAFIKRYPEFIGTVLV